MMNGYERMVAALNGQPVDKIPVLLHNFVVAAREINLKTFVETARNYIKM